ncbi:kinase, partial [Lacticaseibacillus paracasei]|nr:kinase [Lacticaseibacillus paracasei]
VDVNDYGAVDYRRLVEALREAIRGVEFLTR